MKLFEDICEKYFKSGEELEKDLISVLREKNKQGKRHPHINGDYFGELYELLYKAGCLDDKVHYYQINEKGKDCIKRGWVIMDYTTPKRTERWKTIREWAALVLAVISLAVGSYFPRTSPGKASHELEESSVSVASPDTCVISVARDSTTNGYKSNQTTENCNKSNCDDK